MSQIVGTYMYMGSLRVEDINTVIAFLVQLQVTTQQDKFRCEGLFSY